MSTTNYTDDTFSLPEGYWRITNDVSENGLIRCPFAERSCPGGDVAGEDACTDGFRGTLCGQADEHSYLDFTAVDSIQCHFGWTVASALLFLLVMTPLLFCISCWYVGNSNRSGIRDLSRSRLRKRLFQISTNEITDSEAVHGDEALEERHTGALSKSQSFEIASSQSSDSIDFAILRRNIQILRNAKKSAYGQSDVNDREFIAGKRKGRGNQYEDCSDESCSDGSSDESTNCEEGSAEQLLQFGCDHQQSIFRSTTSSFHTDSVAKAAQVEVSNTNLWLQDRNAFSLISKMQILFFTLQV